MVSLLFLLLLFPVTSFAIDCPEGYFSVRAHPRNSYVMADGTRVAATDVREQCRPYRSLKPPVLVFTTTTPPKWKNKNAKYRPWTKAEEASLRAIVESLPRSLTHFGEIKFLREIGPAQTPGYSNSFYQVIAITDAIAGHDLRRVVSHELAHFYWDSMQKDEHKRFNDSANWVESRDGKTISLQRSNVPILDSYTGPHEDFTNSVELFVHDKSLLKSSPLLLQCLENLIQ